MKRGIIVGCVLASLAVGATICRADSTAEDAQKALADKAAARAAARSKLVEVTAGELEDLKFKVASLQSQLDALRAAKNAPPPAKRFEEIELGMTKSEVKAFIDQHKSYMSVVGITATSGVSKTSSQVTVKESGRASVNRSGQQTVRRGSEGEDLAGTGRTKQIDANGNATIESAGTREVELTTKQAKRETMEIAKFTTTRKQTGTEIARGSFGQIAPVYSDVTERTGTIHVTFEDDVVVGIDAH